MDPWRWDEDDGLRAACVLVTDGRIDHCCEEDLAAASADGGAIVCPAPAADRVARTLGRAVRGVRPGDALRLDPDPATPGAGPSSVGVLGAGAPSRAAGFLPRGAGVTYLVEHLGARWLFLGASDALPEHEGLAPDVAFFAVGGFTMPTPEEAAAAAARVRPRLAVPTHWGDLSARYAAAQRFVALCRERGIAAAAVGAAPAAAR